jgi:hypothetical protein
MQGTLPGTSVKNNIGTCISDNEPMFDTRIIHTTVSHWTHSHIQARHLTLPSTQHHFLLSHPAERRSPA